MNKKVTAHWFEIILLFVVPILLLYIGIIPFKYRFWLGGAVFLLILISIYKEKLSLKKLGIRFDNFGRSVLPYTIFTLVGILLALLAAKSTGRNQITEWWSYYHFQFLFLPISIFQEFFYRGYLMAKLEQIISSTPLLIITNAFLFMLLHIIFPYPEVMLPLAFLAGVAFATIYKLFPNLILISISHAILNFIAVLYCFFSFNSSC